MGLVLLTLACSVTPLLSKGFLVQPRGGTHKIAAGLNQDLRDAMAEAMGCGGHFTETEVASIKKNLQPTWRTLPKNDGLDRVEQRSMHYLVFPYFSKGCTTLCPEHWLRAMIENGVPTDV